MNQAVSSQGSSTLEHYFLLACLFPFVSPFPVGSDLQPIAGLLGVVILAHKFTLREIKFDNYTLLIIGFFLYSSIHLGIDYVHSRVNLGKHSSFIYGMILLWTFQYTKGISYKLFSTSLYVYFCLCLLSYIIPDFYYDILQQPFINQRKIDGEINTYVFVLGGVRGASILAPEPSYYGAILGVFLLLNQAQFDAKHQSKVKFLGHLCLIFIQIILNKSGAGLLLFAIYVGYLFVVYLNILQKIQVFIFVFIVIVLVASYLQIGLEDISEFGRSLDLAIKILNQDFDSLQEDVSMGVRFTDFLVGVLSLGYYPLGLGIGGVKNGIVFLNDTYNLNMFLYEDREGVVSSLSYGLMAFGVPFLLLMLYVFISSKAKWVEKIFAFIFVSLLGSFGFPGIWAILATKLVRR